MGHSRHAAPFRKLDTLATRTAAATRAAATLIPALFLALPLAPLFAAPRQLPPDSVVLRLIRERVDSGRNPGIVVGLLDEGGTSVVAYGSSGVSGLPLDGRTLFEIGSVTKTFTTALLADMVARGEVRLEEPVGKLLPDSVRVPSYRGRQITLLDLATHTSGLPRIPTNLHSRDPEDPWADYTVSDLYRFLNSYELPSAPGAEVAYSNVGLGLLGYALALRGGKSYEALLSERILDPLGMSDTRVTLAPAQERRLAQGYDESGKAVEHWHIPTLPGAGALRSDVDDLFLYLAAHLGLSGGDLIPILARTHQTYTRLGDTLAIALGWLVDRSDPARPFWYHDGETGGFHSFAAFEPAGARAVVILSNGANSINDIGFRILALGNSLTPRDPGGRDPGARTVVYLRLSFTYAWIGCHESAPPLSSMRTESLTARTSDPASGVKYWKRRPPTVSVSPLTDQVPARSRSSSSLRPVKPDDSAVRSPSPYVRLPVATPPGCSVTSPFRYSGIMTLAG